MDLPALVRSLVRFVVDVAVPTITAHAVLALTLAFISPKSAGVRLAASIATAAFCAEAIRRCKRDVYEESSYADYMFGLAFHTNCYLVLLNLGPPPILQSAWEKLQWAVNALFSPRMGTKPNRRDPQDMTKGAFLLRRTIVAICIGSFWLYTRDGDRFQPSNIGPELWTPSKHYMTPQILAGTLTLHDVWFRASMCFYAISGSALTVCGAHTICAIIAVGIFDSPLQSWPPLFGDIREAYTLRRWYSHFWHKAMRKAFTLHAAAITEKGLHLRAHTTAGRSVMILLSFLFSGVMHTVTGWQSDTGRLEDACVNHYAPLQSLMLTAIFILVEAAVQSTYIAAHNRVQIPWTMAEKIFWRLIGYCWVAFFMIEFSVSSLYPQLHCVGRLEAM